MFDDFDGKKIVVDLTPTGEPISNEVHLGPWSRIADPTAPGRHFQVPGNLPISLREPIEPEGADALSEVHLSDLPMDVQQAVLERVRALVSVA